jgi:uncharacterized protein YkwD
LLVYLLILFGWFLKKNYWGNGDKESNLLDPLRGYVTNSVATPTIEQPVKEMVETTLRPTMVVKNPVVATKVVGDTRPWGVASQVDEHTWTMKVGMDKRMGTPEEILRALNEYRIRRGSQPLTMDSNLTSYAQERATYLNNIKTTDGHKGFSDFLENQSGYDKLGFTWLGENISYGYQLEGVHLIEWMYAGDKPHDDNQVNNRWNYVGIGVKGLATAIIFGTGKR